MGVTKIGSGDVAAKVMAFQDNLHKAIIFMLQYLGENLVKYAKDHHTYTDRSGNLTNSIGYAVVRDTKIVHYGATNQPGISADSALQTALKMASESESAYSLIIVAGMNYAAYVEAKGYCVILPAELKARKDFPNALSMLVAKAISKTNELFGGIL